MLLVNHTTRFKLCYKIFIQWILIFLVDSPGDLRTQLYHLPKVHESDQTYTVPAKQTLLQPSIGGSQPIQPVLTPQPQYIYVQSPHANQPYMPQAQ